MVARSQRSWAPLRSAAPVIAKNKPKLVLVLGGANSGKSEFAEKLAPTLGERVLFVATGSPVDETMRLRIAANRERRPQAWRTVEVGTNIARALAREPFEENVVLLDSLSSVVSNTLLRGRSHDEAGGEKSDPAIAKKVAAETEALVKWFAGGKKSLVVVSDEVGMGLAPPDMPLAAEYTSLLASQNRRLADDAHEVFLMIAGMPLDLRKIGRLPGTP